MKRIKLKMRKPNPLFELWLEEWRDEAVSRNSNLQYIFSKALASLKKYPLPLESGMDCMILQHFGMKLCSMLDKRLEKHKARSKSSSADDLACAHCNYDNEHTSKRNSKSSQVKGNLNYADQRTELAAFDKLNLPSWDMGNYVVLLILYKKTQDPYYSGFTTEAELLIEVKEFCDHVWKVSIMKLFDNGLISMVNAPLRYSLTEYGVNIAKKICEITATDAKLISSSKDFQKIQSYIKSLYIQNSVATKSSENLIRNTDSKKSEECRGNIQNSASKSSWIQRSQSVEIAVREIFKQTEECFIKETDKEINIHTERLQEKAKTKRNVNKCTQNKAGGSKTDATDSLQKDIHLEPNNFDIILLVDTHETSGGKTKPQHDVTLKELFELGVSFEVRHLKIGDFAWIARCRVTNNELVLPYVVERKRIDDLSASITDGRYYEQKATTNGVIKFIQTSLHGHENYFTQFRLKQSGIANLMYIVEQYDKNKKITIPYPSLMQASINTLIQDGFLVKYTRNHKDSMFYLSSVTRILKNVFKDKILIGCKKENLGQTDISSDILNLMEFHEFNKAASKQKVFKVREMFIRHLLQLKGMSVEKASAVTEVYSTPRLLLDALQSSDGNGELLLSGIVCGSRKRQLGSVLSKTVYQLYTKKHLN